MVEKKVLRSMAHGVFQSPLTDLSLTEGGGGALEWNISLVGPFPLHGINSLFQTTTAYHF
jgi:hypothetical protein